jgi:hypothetical protein
MPGRLGAFDNHSLSRQDRLTGCDLVELAVLVSRGEDRRRAS